MSNRIHETEGRSSSRQLVSARIFRSLGLFGYRINSDSDSVKRGDVVVGSGLDAVVVGEIESKGASFVAVFDADRGLQVLEKGRVSTGALEVFSGPYFLPLTTSGDVVLSPAVLFGAGLSSNEIAMNANVSNKSDSVLHLDSFLVSCSCMEVEPPATRVLMPGEEVSFTVKMNLGGGEYNNQYLRIMGRVNAEAIDVKLPVSGWQPVSLKSTPASVICPPVFKGEDSAFTVKLQVGGAESVSLTSSTTFPLPSSSISFDEKYAQGERFFLIDGSIKTSSLRVGEFRGDLVISLLVDGANRTVAVPVFGVVKPSVTFSSSVIGGAPGSTLSEAPAIRPGVVLGEVSVESCPSWLECSFESGRLKIEFDSEASRGLAGVISLSCNVNDWIEEIEIPVFVEDAP